MINLRSIFFKDEEDEEPQNEQSTIPVREVPQQSQPQAPAQPQQQSQPTAYVQPTDTSDVNENIIRKMWEILADRNLPGPDMLEVKNYAASLESTGLPLEKRYEAAFLMLKSQYPDFSKDTLLKSVDTYISYVNEEFGNGKQQFQNKRNEKVGKKEEGIARLTKENEETAKKIEELKIKLEKNMANIDNMKKEIETANAEIAHEEAVFNNTFSHFIKTLEKDKQTMSNLNIN